MGLNFDARVNYVELSYENPNFDLLYIQKS